MVSMQTVENILKDNMCIGCGSCAASCPKNCISLKLIKDSVTAVIDNECLHCGKCLSVCPSNHIQYPPVEKIDQYVLGNYVALLYAKAKNIEQLKRSVSGGVISSITKELLRTHKYDIVFAVKSNDISKPIKSELVDNADNMCGIEGSRYLTISHEDAIRCAITHPDKKIVFISTSCCTSGIVKSIIENRLNRENYLIIGLFCDKTMNYGIYRYFSQHPKLNGQKIVDFQFRSKRTNGWPGDIVITTDNYSEISLERSERKRIKDFFVPERCLYCWDKLNVNADISVGDNYIIDNKDMLGSSSVLIRNSRGQQAWKDCEFLFDVHEDAVESLLKSQAIRNKTMNCEFASIKGLNNINVDKRVRKEYSKIMLQRKLSTQEKNYQIIKCYILLERIKRHLHI